MKVNCDICESEIDFPSSVVVHYHGGAEHRMQTCERCANNVLNYIESMKQR